jgi:membrane protein
MSLKNIALWPLAKDVFAKLGRDRVGLVSAGIAFYGLLSLFPGIAAMMALGGLIVRPSVLVSQLNEIGAVLPPEAQKIIVDQATQIAGSQTGGLGLTVLFGIGLALYSASRAVASLVMGIHVAANAEDTRGFLAGYVFTLAMTLVTVLLVLLALFSTVIIPAILAALAVEGWVAWVLGLVRWPLMGVITAFGLGLFYRLSVRNRSPQPAWITPGAVLGAVLWLAGSVAFSIYVQNFANYNKSFGTLGGVVSLLTWLWLSSYIVLLGEEVNTLLTLRQKPEPDSQTPSA